MREDGLRLAARQLAEHFRDLRDPQHLKPKHITHVIEQWQAEKLSVGTIKNRVSHLRWLADKIGKQNIIPRDNAVLGIERRVYAQARYQELTGWASPAAGGPTSKALSGEQRDRDQLARLQISRELGHEREQITAVYLGR